MKQALFDPGKAVARLRDAFPDDALRAALRERRLVHAPGALSGLTSGLLDFACLDDAFAAGSIAADDLRMWIGRTRINLRLMKVRDGDCIVPEGLAQLRRQGAAMTINDLQRRFASLADLSAGVMDWLGDPVEVTGVVSHGSRSGIPVHHDEENAFLIQLEGAKHWTFFGDPVTPGMHTNDVVQEGSVKRELVMRPGDVLFLPAGQRHSCVGDRDSLHIGLLILHSEAASLFDENGRDPALNEPYLAFVSEEDRAGVLSRYEAHLQGRLGAMDLAAALARQRELALADERFKFLPAKPISPRQDG